MNTGRNIRWNGRRVLCEKGGGGECRERVTIVIGMGFSPRFLCEKHGTEQLLSLGLSLDEPDLITWTESECSNSTRTR